MGIIASTDHELVEASRRGELDAFGQLVERYQDLVCAVSFSSTGDRALSEDVAQETFVAAWRRLDRVRKGSLRPWLCAIARNLGRKARRRARREEPIEEDAYVAPGASPFDDLARADSERIVRDALARVPEKYREVLVLYYRDNQAVADVAETLAISEDAVMQRLSRGRRYLADGVTAIVEKSLRGTRPRRDLVAAVLGAVAAIAIPSRVDAASLKTKGSTMLKLALAASALVAAGTTVYFVTARDHTPAATPTPIAASPAATTLHYGTGAARRPALGPTAPVHATAARTATVDDLALLPHDAEFVLGIDVARIQQSPLWKTLAAPALASSPALHDFEAECGFDPIASLSSITIGMKDTTHDAATGAIVVHGFPKAKVLACIVKLAPRHEASAQLRIEGDVILFNEPHGPTAVTFLDDTTALVVIGSDATKDGVAQVASRRDQGPAGYSELLHEINTDDAVWLAVTDGSRLLAHVNETVAKHSSIQLHGLYGSIDFSDGLVINAGARTGSPELVAKLVSDLQHHIDDHVARGDLGQKFDQLDVHADGGDVIVSLAMNMGEFLPLAASIGGSVTGHVHDNVGAH